MTTFNLFVDIPLQRPYFTDKGCYQLDVNLFQLTEISQIVNKIPDTTTLTFYFNNVFCGLRLKGNTNKFSVFGKIVDSIMRFTNYEDHREYILDTDHCCIENTKAIAIELVRRIGVYECYQLDTDDLLIIFPLPTVKVGMCITQCINGYRVHISTSESTYPNSSKEIIEKIESKYPSYNYPLVISDYSVKLD